jgi:hypothetical protein
MSKAVKSIINKKLAERPPSRRNIGEDRVSINVTNIKQAKRLLTRIIRGYQENRYTDKKVKTLAYLLQVMVQIVKEFEFNERLSKLEERIKNERSK